MTRGAQFDDCPTEQLILFHYGELSAADQQRLKQHLSQCSTCRAELSSLQEVLAQVPINVPELTTSELRDFSSRVMKNLPQRRRFSRPMLGWSLAGAVVVMLTLNLQPQVEISTPVSFKVPVVAEQKMSDQEMVTQFDLLQDLALLENLDLLQQLASVE